MTRAYLGVGTNLGDRQSALEQALGLLACRPGIRLLRVSSLYETEPEDVAGGWFLNGVVEVETSLGPRELLDTLVEVEEACGRPRRRQRGEPRVADLDLLLYGSQTMAEPGLEVPHPRMHLRRFVLVPLVELDPDLMHPGLGIRIGDLLTRLPGDSDVRVTVRDWFGAAASKRDVP
jgi:2-amino-4-hydroxy-6-hydroxymethyldihydropteridine diphosphokinase